MFRPLPALAALAAALALVVPTVSQAKAAGLAPVTCTTQHRAA